MSDAGALAPLVERIDALRQQVKLLDTRLSQAVTFRQLLTGLATCFGLLVLVSGGVIVRAEMSSESAGARGAATAIEAKALAAELLVRQQANETYLKTELQTFKADVRADIRELREDVKAIAAEQRQAPP